MRKDAKGNLKDPSTVHMMNPGQIWVEDRWVFVRRMFGDELVSKIFYRVISWVWTQSDMNSYAKQQLQDNMLWEMFRQQGSKFSRDYQSRVAVTSWDNKKQGYITFNRIHQIAQNVALLGPLAGMMGRHVEHELQLNPMLVLLSTSLMDRAQKENKVLKDSDIEKDSWSYWDTHQEGTTFNEPPVPVPKSASSTPAPSLVLIPGPRYTDVRERGRSRLRCRRASSSNSSGSQW